jgi:lipoyl(octanoyl) transferase
MKKSEWRLIISEALPGALNMAFDEALLEAVSGGKSPPVLRFYRWIKPTVSLGYGQDSNTGLNLEFCHKIALPVVRRITGGRAVIHDNELTYALISPSKNSIFPGSIQDNYLIIAGALKEAIEKFGVPVQLAPGRRGGKNIGAENYRHNACFNSPSIYELVAEGCKITGSAQVHRQDFFLQHGSIPIEMDLGLIVQALSPGHQVSLPKGEEYLFRKVGWLNRFSREPVDIHILQNEMIAAFSGRFNIHLNECGFTENEMERARVLQREKYDNPLWNLHRKGGGATSFPAKRG